MRPSKRNVRRTTRRTVRRSTGRRTRRRSTGRRTRRRTVRRNTRRRTVRRNTRDYRNKSQKGGRKCATQTCDNHIMTGEFCSRCKSLNKQKAAITESMGGGSSMFSARMGTAAATQAVHTDLALINAKKDLVKAQKKMQAQKIAEIDELASKVKSMETFNKGGLNEIISYAALHFVVKSQNQKNQNVFKIDESKKIDSVSLIEYIVVEFHKSGIDLDPVKNHILAYIKTQQQQQIKRVCIEIIKYIKQYEQTEDYKIHEGARLEQLELEAEIASDGMEDISDILAETSPAAGGAAPKAAALPEGVPPQNRQLTKEEYKKIGRKELQSKGQKEKKLQALLKRLRAGNLILKSDDLAYQDALEIISE